MLVLTRKPSEMIQIGDNIVIKVLEIRRNTVKIGIEAPTEVTILRSEINNKSVAAPLPAGTVADSLADRLKLIHNRLNRENVNLPPVAANV